MGLEAPPPPPGSLSAPPSFKKTKKHPKTSVKMKNFYWQKIPSSKVPKYWGDVDDESVTLDTAELEKLFPAQAPKVEKDSTSETSTHKLKKPEIVNLIDPRRGNNIGILFLILHLTHVLAIVLSQIKMSFSDIKKAILDCDDKKLGLDTLEALHKYIPEPHELERIRTFEV